VATFPQTVLPLLSEIFVNDTWTNITSDVRREDGYGVRVSRKPLSWGDRIASTTASHVFKNASLNYNPRNPTGIYFGQLGRNTPIRHRLRIANDTFTRSASSSWGSTEDSTPLSWTTSGGSASDFSVNGTQGVHALTSVNVTRSSRITPSIPVADVRTRVGVSATPTGADITVRVATGVDISNFYAAWLNFTTTGLVTVRIAQVSGGSTTFMTTAVTAATLVPGTLVSARVKIEFGRIWVKLWDGGYDSEPSTWTQSIEFTATFAATIAGVFSRAETGNTNVNPQVLYDLFEVNSWRFWGQIPQFAPQADQSGKLKTVPIIASGLGQQLGAGARALKSAMTRAMDGTTLGDFNSFACWPMEEPSGATQFASAKTGHLPASISGAVQPAAYAGAAGSDAVPTLSAGGQIAAVIPPYDGSGLAWQFQAMAYIPTEPAANCDFFEVNIPPNTVDKAIRIKVQYVLASRILTARAYNSSGVQVGFGGACDMTVAGMTGQPILLSLQASDLAGNTTILFSALAPGYSAFGVGNLISFGTGGYNGSQTVATGWRAYAVAANAGWSFSHATLYADPTFLTIPNDTNNSAAINGYIGELTGIRIPRLCREQGIPCELIGDSADTSPCGPQQSGPLLTNLLNAADADQGVLFETRDALALAYRTRTSLHNMPTLLTLNHRTTNDPAGFAVTDDDKTVRNKITARRFTGSFATAEVTTGRTSTSEPPDGIGEYPEDLSWSLGADSQLVPFAGWRAHRGSWDEARYPAVKVMRQRSEIYGTATKDAGCLLLDLSSHFTITAPRADLPPDDIELLVQGYDEILANFEHEITWDTAPNGPYVVMTIGDGEASRVGGSHKLITAVDTTATSWDIATTDGPVLITADAADGWTWDFTGERVQVTDVAPSTIAFGAAGTADSGSSGSRTSGLPAGLATGNLVLIFASTRNSGTGVPVTPANWARHPAFETSSNAQLFGRIKDAAWSTMPTITFTGGAANEDTIAQSASLTGKFYDINRVFVDSAGRLNASAQDIITPGIPLTRLPPEGNFIALYLGWKQDDYTSVATPGSWTEIQEASSIAGNDASQVWGYRVFTSMPAANSLQPSIVVTGGAAAISRGVVVIFASDYQVVTVTRSLNSVVKSHIVGEIPTRVPRSFVAL
jgi:hypothetical protein